LINGGWVLKKNRKNKKLTWTKRGSSRIFASFLSTLAVCLQVVEAEELKGVVSSDLNQVRDKNSFTAGATVGEVIMLKEELKFLQGELIEVLEKYEVLKERDENLNSSVVSKMIGIENKDSEEILSVSRRALNVISEMSRKQSAQTIVFCDTLSQKLKDVDMDELEKFKLMSELKSLRRGAEKIVGFLNGEQQIKTDSCNVLSVDDKLRIVVLAVGMKDGVKVGDTWYVKGDVALKVVSVRSYVAATMLQKGKMSDIAPGVKAFKKAVTRTKK